MGAPKKMMGPGAKDAEGVLVWMVRTFGVRDVVLGAGTLKAVSDGGPAARLWVQVSAAADTLDVGNALVFRSELDRMSKAASLGLAVPAALGGWWASTRLGS